jgi:hypothetical protein
MKKQRGQKGSILVLTIVSVLVLSLIVMGLLSVGTTEIHSTQNLQLSRSAYYTALGAVEEIRQTVADNYDPLFDPVSKSPADTKIIESFDAGSEDRKWENLGIRLSYITGTLKDFRDDTPQVVDEFIGFPAPHARGLKLGVGGGEDTVLLKTWKVEITAESLMGERIGTGASAKGGRVSYSEIIAGIRGIYSPTGE